MGSHARLSPSAAVRWIVCPGSVSLDDPEEEDPSEFAAEGTVAHEIRAECLSLGFDPSDFLGQEMVCDGFPFTVTQEMVDYLTPGIERVRAHNAIRLDIEYRTDLRQWIEEGFGTTDVGLVTGPDEDDLIVIDDLKYGAGVAVSPVENWQLMIYGLGYWWNVARHLTKARRFLLRIDQPRISGAGGEWYVTLDELLEWAKLILVPGAKRAMTSSKLQASEKGCRWCRRKSTCPELARFNMDVMSAKFDDVSQIDVVEMELPTIPVLSAERRGYILKHKQQIIDWLGLLHEQALHDALQGSPTPGQKVVLGKRPTRAWKSPEEAAAALAEIIDPEKVFTSPEVISVAVAEKLVGKAKFGKNATLKALVSQGEAKPILVDETDPRESVQSFGDKFLEMMADEESV